MKSAHMRIMVPAAVLLGAVAVPALAQRPGSPEQRIAVLEQQVAASQATSMRLEQRLDSIERQLQQLINLGEVNGHGVSELQAEIGRLKSDLQSRMSALESRPADTRVEEAKSTPAEADRPATRVAAASKPDTSSASESSEEASADPGEEAYSEGFRLWRDGKYDQSITALRAFLSGFPKHRRASFARNLIGRALLDKGQPRPAAEALLANYRSDPKGERAADSLYYLGQSLMKLNQPSQACKAYAELEDVYGNSVRADLRSLVDQGKADAGCS